MAETIVQVVKKIVKRVVCLYRVSTVGQVEKDDRNEKANRHIILLRVSQAQERADWKARSPSGFSFRSCCGRDENHTK